ncbi:HDOD domain-containing protein [Candidatus Magnetobacterium casense]|uniref:HDOD domain-containing protein n=1 Tax=Candidatus Magnetobacterium casense TaxID=1455061 RepID=A0ABS6RY38_9BACT|nr:HDOD domain-containing protein [Candidatus Magnetobacterium casensis]MBV6341526.1 HDOD domain-containing protein [Candidatus Magnetobacterium casensis]
MAETKIPVIARILDGIRAKGEFPVMGRTVALVSTQTKAGSKASVDELTNTILDDISLTNKLLRLVNSAAYVKYNRGGKINTISRTIHILGFSHVRDVALSLVLFETIKDNSMSVALREAVLVSFLSGVIAKRMGSRLGMRELEETFICSMFHSLGKLLLVFYLPDEHRKIVELAKLKKVSEYEIAISVLNVAYDTIGITIAKHWNFSENILLCMQKIPLNKLDKPKNNIENIRCLSLFSNNLCELLNTEQMDVNMWKDALNSFTNMFDNCDQSMVTEVLEASFNILMAHCADSKFNINYSHITKNLSFMIKGQDIPIVQQEIVKPVSSLQILDNTHDSEDDSNEIVTPDDILARGILDITNTLLEEFSLNDLLRMILETLYRGMEFTRTIISIKNAKGQSIDGRFGLGRNIENLVKHFRFPIDKDSNDVFNISLSKDSIVVINNVNDVEVQSCIPNWLHTVFNAQTFILIPISVRKTPIGLIYGDWATVNPQAMKNSRMRYVKMLKNQAVLAIKQAM